MELEWSHKPLSLLFRTASRPFQQSLGTSAPVDEPLKLVNYGLLTEPSLLLAIFQKRCSKDAHTSAACHISSSDDMRAHEPYSDLKR